jgi:hypothetical protein
MTQLLDRQSIIDALKALPKEDVAAIQASVKEQIKASRKPRVKKRRYTCAITDTVIIADDNPNLTFYVQMEGTQNANKLSMSPMVAGDYITRPRKPKANGEENGNGNGSGKELPLLTALGGVEAGDDELDDLEDGEDENTDDDDEEADDDDEEADDE